MSPYDEDLSSALPRPPLPAPARREAAIAAALRRFDGVAEMPAREGRPAAAAPWRRPAFGALAGAALVALIALPLAWTSLDDRPYRGAPASPPAGEDRPRPAARAVGPPAPPADRGEALRAPAAASDEAPVPAAPDTAKAVPEPAPIAVPPPATEPSAVRAVDEPSASEEARGEQVVITGTRIPQPNLESAVPITVVGGSEFAKAGRKAVARPARRGDWNACTVDDPAPSLADCRTSRAIADGLERAWRGDWDGAARAFDAAIAAAPRSSAAWLNRGLVHRRNGDLDKALADLDRAVRFSPRSARFYYQRSLVLREQGKESLAEADEARAVSLDPRYAVLVRGR